MGNNTRVYIWNKQHFKSAEEAVEYYRSIEDEYEDVYKDGPFKVEYVSGYENRYRGDFQIWDGPLERFRESVLNENRDNVLFYSIMIDIIEAIDGRSGDYQIYCEHDC